MYRDWTVCSVAVQSLRGTVHCTAVRASVPYLKISMTVPTVPKMNDETDYWILSIRPVKTN